MKSRNCFRFQRFCAFNNYLVLEHTPKSQEVIIELNYLAVISLKVVVYVLDQVLV